MIGFRDRNQSGPHVLKLGGVSLEFGPDGVLWEPTEEQLSIVEGHALRKARFERVEMVGVREQEAPVVGDAFAEAVREAAKEPASRPAEATDDDDLGGTFR